MESQEQKLFKQFVEEIKGFPSFNSINKEIEILVRGFSGVSGWSITDDVKFTEAPAAIDIDSKSIIFNPILILSELFSLRKELGFYDKIDRQSMPWSKIASIAALYKKFLFLHELSHWLYTASAKTAISLIQKYCDEIPPQLAMFLSNVVEDSVIQRFFMIDYPSKNFREIFNFGIAISQGTQAVKTYVETAEAQQWNIRTKLFYFILRAYNLHNKYVQDMFNLQDKIGWQQDTIEAFDEAIIITDKFERAEYTFKVLAPLVYRDLLVEPSEEQQGGDEGSQDLLEAQNLVKPQQSKQDNERQQQNEEGQQESDSNDSGDGGTSKNEADNQESKADKEKSESDKDSNSSNSSSKDSSDDSTTDTDTQNQPSESSQKGGGKGKKTLEDMKKEIAEVCEDLNKQIKAQNEPVDRGENIRTPIPDLNVLNEINSDIKDATRFLLSGQKSPLSDLTQNIYKSAICVLDKIFTMKNDVFRGLDHGELDEDELYTYYTEKNLNIYQEQEKLKQDKRIVCYFVLDISGSMHGNRLNSSLSAVVALIHAFEDIGIKCCFLTFDQETYVLKRFNDVVPLYGTSSTLQYAASQISAGGGTKLLPSLAYIANDSSYLENEGEEVHRLVVIATDGNTDDYNECRSLIQEIGKDTLVYGVGIEMGSNFFCLKELIGTNGVSFDYSVQELGSKMPEDIYNTVVDKFLLY